MLVFACGTAPPSTSATQHSVMEHFAEIASMANNEIADDDFQAEYEEEAPSNSKKRKADDGQPQQRSKRNRYVSIACNEV